MIDRHLETGEPTGLLFQMDAFLSERIPPLNAQELERGVKRANRELLALGITSIQDASSLNDMGRWSMFRSWKEKSLLKPRVSMMLGVGGLNRNGRHEFTTGLDENQLRLGAVKIILDESTGRLFPSQSQLNEMVLEIHQSGLQVAVHAIEERAVESACSA
ncbi:MAG: amidohydrolase family protein, partial [Proteobacteria bacterium]|nr:amidohydrolase family protein [Pseudomonadota bacterium]